MRSFRRAIYLAGWLLKSLFLKLTPARRVLLGRMLVKRGETDRATRQFEEALKLEPDDNTAAYQLALLYRKAGNTKRAEELMTKVGKATSVPDSKPISGRDLVKIVREASK